MPQYPDEIYTPRTMTNLPGLTRDIANTQNLYAEDYNETNQEVIAIENTLGVNPEGDFETVKERLDNVDTELSLVGPDPFIESVKAIGSDLKSVSPVTFFGSGGTSLTDGRLTLNATYLTKSATITGIQYYQYAQGAFTGDNNNKLGLYSYSEGVFTLVASTSNDETHFKKTSRSWNQVSFTTPYVATAGLYFIATLYNYSAQTTPPSVVIGITSANANFLSFKPSSTVTFCMYLAGQTDLPSSINSSACTGDTLYKPMFLY